MPDTKSCEVSDLMQTSACYCALVGGDELDSYEPIDRVIIYLLCVWANS